MKTYDLFNDACCLRDQKWLADAGRKLHAMLAKAGEAQS